ncbi:MAG: MFS transporter, partial [Pandoraea sp.]|nr:MFS transporter [Pandoraea sp.]
ARTLVASTDRLFSFVIDPGLRGWFLRRVWMPRVMPLAAKVPAVRRAMFRLISQTRIEYRPSPLSIGAAGRVHAGDRLPWLVSPDNFAPLVARDWQVHVYGAVGPALREVAAGANVPVHAFPWGAAARKVGLSQDAIYLVRPDGYVGFAGRQNTMGGLKSYLSRSGLNYENQAAPAGTMTTVKIGDKVISSVDGKAADAKEKTAAFEADMSGTLKADGYPPKADPAQMNKPMVVVLLTILVIFVTMVYGPIAAMLVEMFPTRIRYTSMSLPYHIGNGWFGGFLPATAFAIVAAKGDIYSGLWYPIIIALATFVIGMLFIKETKDVDIYAND